MMVKYINVLQETLERIILKDFLIKKDLLFIIVI